VYAAVDIAQTTVVSNTALNAGGGGIHLQNCLSGVRFTACNVSQNSAAYKGGGVLSEFALRVQFVDTDMQGNSASEGAAAYMTSEYLLDPEYKPAWVDPGYSFPDSHRMYGEASVLFQRTSMSGNTANEMGGGVVLAGHSSTVVQASNILDNHAQQSGGGVAAIQGAALTVTDARIERNSAVQCGGGLLWSSNQEISVSGTLEISQNTAGSLAGVGDTSLTGLDLTGNGGGVCLLQRQGDMNYISRSQLLIKDTHTNDDAVVRTSRYDARVGANAVSGANTDEEEGTTSPNACSDTFENSTPLLVRARSPGSGLVMSGNTAELGGGAVYVDCVPKASGTAWSAYSKIIQRQQRRLRTYAYARAHTRNAHDARFRDLFDDKFGISYEESVSTLRQQTSTGQTDQTFIMTFTGNRAGYGGNMASTLNSTVLVGAVEKGQMPGAPLHGTVWLLDSWGQRAQRATGTLPYTIKVEVCTGPCHAGGELLSTSYYGFNVSGMSALEEGSRTPVLWPSSVGTRSDSDTGSALRRATNSSTWAKELYMRLFVEVGNTNQATLKPLMYTVGRQPCGAGFQVRMVDSVHHLCSECEAGSFNVDTDADGCLPCPAGVLCK
jgi:hypothetical protein